MMHSCQLFHFLWKISDFYTNLQSSVFLSFYSNILRKSLEKKKNLSKHFWNIQRYQELRFVCNYCGYVVKITILQTISEECFMLLNFLCMVKLRILLIFYKIMINLRKKVVHKISAPEKFHTLTIAYFADFRWNNSKFVQKKSRI